MTKTSKNSTGKRELRGDHAETLKTRQREEKSTQDIMTRKRVQELQESSESTKRRLNQKTSDIEPTRGDKIRAKNTSSVEEKTNGRIQATRAKQA